MLQAVRGLFDFSYRGIESPNFQSGTISPVPLPASLISMLAAVGIPRMVHAAAREFFVAGLITVTTKVNN